MRAHIYATLVIYLLANGVLNSQTYNGQGPLSIPDVANCTPGSGLLQSVANVPLTGTLGVDYQIKRVQLNITHFNTQQLIIRLQAPDGTIWELSSNNGGTGDHYQNTIFADYNPSIIFGIAPFSSSFQAEEGPFDIGFDGVDVNGQWRLLVCDQTLGSVGTLQS